MTATGPLVATIGSIAIDRSQLKAASLQLIADRGRHAVTLRDIAAESRLSLGSTTYHFADRTALMRAAIAEYVADVDGGVGHPLVMANDLDLDDAVAVAVIVETMLGRPPTPNESSRLKSAYQRSDSLPALAREIAA